jgi:hypothetical protein
MGRTGWLGNWYRCIHEPCTIRGSHQFDRLQHCHIARYNLKAVVPVIDETFQIDHSEECASLELLTLK